MAKMPSPISAHRGSRLSTPRQILGAMGIHDRIVYPFSPKKVVAALHMLAELLSSPTRVEHPLLRLKWTMAVFWLADVKHFQRHGHPVTGSRYQAYPQGPVPCDVLSLIQGNPLWLSELPESGHCVPYELQGDCLTRNLRIPFGYDPARFLGQSEREALETAATKAKDLKLNNRDAALRGEGFQLTPLYQDIPWELLLPAKMRTREIIDGLISSARRAVV